MTPDDTDFRAALDAGHPEYLKLLDEMRDLHVRKAQDYGRGADPFANVRASADFQVPAWVGTLIRANDKWHRVKSFIVNKRLVNEGVEDTLKDMAAYCLIALVLYRETVRWGGGDHDHPQEAAITPAVTVEQASRCTVCGWPLVAHPDPAVYVPTATAPAVDAVTVTEDDGDDAGPEDTPLVVEAAPLEWEPDEGRTGLRSKCGRYWVVETRHGPAMPYQFDDVADTFPAAHGPHGLTLDQAKEWCATDATSRKQ